MTREDLIERQKELTNILLAEKNQEGFWTGRLSSSALGVAVAIAALHFHDENMYQKNIKTGLQWLIKNINKDGSFGDTPESEGNISTSLLVYAALNLYTKVDFEVKQTQQKIAGYLQLKGININSDQVSKAILDHYKKDYTFSVPILTMCGLCGVPGPEAFRYIPQLPFELSLLPAKFYKSLKLSVVSYAIPALIAVGIVIFRKKKSNFALRFIRKHSIKRSLKLLHKLMPESGGFLEAIPLTAFVNLSLTGAGFKDLDVVEKGINFLLKTQRSDGSWPIDINLSTWVTSLTVKSLRSSKDEVLSLQVQNDLVKHFLKNQNHTYHPFNRSKPGGWGWTNHPGSVPDADDTSGAILAMFHLKSAAEIKDSLLRGCDWLVNLQNSDGGIPTFSKGWGKLPFDKSCADVTGHALLAVSLCTELFGNDPYFKINKYKKFFKRAVKYLENHQNNVGSWNPLWFGNQLVKDHSNPVYGTSKIMSYLGEILMHNWIDYKSRIKIKRLYTLGQQYLLSAQNTDGSWGGSKNIPGTIEETSLAVSALPSSNREQKIKGLIWLDSAYKKNGLKASPIGLYFASLWYDEKMYPLTAYLEAITRMLEDDILNG